MEVSTCVTNVGICGNIVYMCEDDVLTEKDLKDRRNANQIEASKAMPARSNLCEPYSRQLLCSPIPFVPTNISASAYNYEDSLVICDYYSPDSEYYNIYRATEPEGTKNLLISTPEIAWTDTVINIDTKYYYWVEACNENGCSELSKPDVGYLGIVEFDD